MDGSNPSVKTTSGDTSFKLHEYSPSDQLHAEHEECTWSIKVNIKLIYEEFLNDSSFGKKDEVVLHEEDSLELLSIGDLEGDLSGPTLSVDCDEKINSNKVKSHQELSYCVPLDQISQKCLTKSATFPCSVEVQNGPSANISNSVSISANQDQLFSSSNPGYTRSVSLPTSLKLLSAMKGSRAKNGASTNMKLHVKWAPDVYDPPATSLSHTVKKSYQQRPKAKRKGSKKNKTKGKSSRESTGKRTANRISIIDTAEHVDLRQLGCGGSLKLDGYGKSKVEVSDYAVSEQDAKCGSSFLRKALSEIHISVGEAS